jgi:hypothetical protein|tara:strand:+ start:102 stop:464 length:363 start_codon:yes stop_codon:yes gene_type:complete
MSTYYFGQSPDNSLGDSPRYLYMVRRNDDGEIFLRRIDNLVDKDTVDLNYPGVPEQTFEDFEPGIDYFDGIAANHENNYENLRWSQYRWDQRSILYYVDSEGMLVQRINQNYQYPQGTSS